MECDDSEEQEEYVSDESIIRLYLLGHKCVNGVNTDVLSFFYAVADADVDKPDEHVTRKLFRPADGVLKYVAEEYLYYDEDTHDSQKRYTNDFFNVVVEPFHHFHLCFTFLLHRNDNGLLNRNLTLSINRKPGLPETGSPGVSDCFIL